MVEQWLKENTLYCEALKIRMSPKHCKTLKKRRSVQELTFAEMIFGRSPRLRPFTCKDCPGLKPSS